MVHSDSFADADFARFFSGERLYGDDFNQAAIATWFAEEEEGYARLGAGNQASYSYEYHGWNSEFGFRYLTEGPIQRALGLGSAYGEEFAPILPRIQSLTIVDPSDTFARSEIRGVPIDYVKPEPSGLLPLETACFELITCLGVLHHIPNVSTVVGELARVLRPGGRLLIREPIVSMGDWRRPRPGLTRNERGIPLRLLDAIVARAGLATVRRTLLGFPPTERLFKLVRADVYNSRAMARLDALASALFSWNVNYHATHIVHRFRPTSAYYVLTKPV